MIYATLMTHVELGRSNAGLLKITGDLAERFGSTVIGAAACEGLQTTYGGPYVTGEVVELVREQAEKQIAEAEIEFRAILSPRVKQLEWRSAETYGPLSDYFAGQSREADLIVTSAGDGSILDGTNRLNVGDLVMRAGRPVLLVPPGSDHVKLDRVLVGWKETREARRAIADALPLLQVARTVILTEIVPDDRLAEARDHLAEVARWLARHGVQAEMDASSTKGSDVGGLAKAANDHAADIIVAGAYGHSRLREWVLGGVTHDLLLSTRRVAFLSH